MFLWMNQLFDWAGRESYNILVSDCFCGSVQISGWRFESHSHMDKFEGYGLDVCFSFLPSVDATGTFCVIRLWFGEIWKGLDGWRFFLDGNRGELKCFKEGRALSAGEHDYGQLVWTGRRRGNGRMNTNKYTDKQTKTHTNKNTKSSS